MLDLVIIGGGCAGLSLGRQIAKNAAWNKQTLIIEARAGYTNDRSWCFWEPNTPQIAADLDSLISHRWQAWRFSSSHFSTVHQLKSKNYCYIPAERFYAESLQLINAHRFIDIECGLLVLEIKPITNGYSILLNNGSYINARQIVDTRLPIYIESKQAKLWQIFYGLEIRTRSDVFEPETIGLMDDMRSSKNGTEFRYTLPFTSSHALVEITSFTSNLQAPESLRNRLLDWLNDSIGINQYEIIRIEKGCLPMGLQFIKKRESSSYIYAGTAAGAVRPATGYAFMRIQHWAYQCANALSLGQDLISFKPSSAIVKAMDNIFLNVLKNNPNLGTLFFTALAKKVDACRLVRFLSEEAKPMDYWQVVNALPKWKFLSYGLGLNRLFFRKQSIQ